MQIDVDTLSFARFKEWNMFAIWGYTSDHANDCVEQQKAVPHNREIIWFCYSRCWFVCLFHAVCVTVNTSHTLPNSLMSVYWIGAKLLICAIVYRLNFTSKSKQNTWKSISRKFFFPFVSLHTVFPSSPQNKVFAAISRGLISVHMIFRLVYHSNDIQSHIRTIESGGRAWRR